MRSRDPGTQRTLSGRDTPGSVRSLFSAILKLHLYFIPTSRQNNLNQETMGFALFVVLGAWFVKPPFLSALDNECLCLHILSADDVQNTRKHILPKETFGYHREG